MQASVSATNDHNCFKIDLSLKSFFAAIKKRLCWQTKWFASREKEGCESTINSFTLSQFQNFCRMSSTDIDYVLQRIGGKIEKQNTNWRPSIPAKTRLILTLRFLATGDSCDSLAFSFKIFKQSISTIVMEVCQAIIEDMKEWIKVSYKT